MTETKSSWNWEITKTEIETLGTKENLIVSNKIKFAFLIYFICIGGYVVPVLVVITAKTEQT